MALDYTNLYPDTSGNGGYTKSWNYTTVVDNFAACKAVGFFNDVATRLGIGDNIVIAQVDAFDKTRTALLDRGLLFVTSIANGIVTTIDAASLASPAFTGIPTAPTATPGTNTTQLATTAYADAISALLTTALALKATLASPTFTGTPAAPTAAPGTNSTQIATTAYADALTAIRVTAEALKANLASPTFTGTPAAPTAAVDTNTTQLATTAMVLAQAASATPLIDGSATVGTSTRFARGDHIHPTDTTRQAADVQLFSNIPQNSKSAAYTTILTDGEKHIFHPSADTTARTFTIDSNANVAYPIGTVLTFVNQNAAGVVTIAITSDTMRLAGAGTTGSRTLAANGIANALKVTSTEWIISGSGLT